MESTIVIQPYGGLCNRLRFIFSFLKKLKKDNQETKINLVIFWEKNNDCNGFYLDYFKKIQNVKFMDKNDNNLIINIKSGGTLEELKKSNYLFNNLIKLKGYMIEKIMKIIHKLENRYIAVHIRRTDFNNHLFEINKLNEKISDQDFIDFLKKYEKYNIYIATDNKETQNYFLNKFKSRIKYINLINDKSNDLRKTTLENAIIDLFVCACCNIFKGTYYSSYTSFIYMLRKNINNFNDPLNSIKIFK